MTSKPPFGGEVVRLGDVCEIVLGQSPSSDSYNSEGNGLPFYQGNADFGKEHPTPKVWCDAPRKTAERGDILLSVRAPIGAINTANETCCIGRGIVAIRPNSAKVCPGYLKQQLLSRRSLLESMGTGSTFKAVGKKVLNEFPVTLYPLPEQELIEEKMQAIMACIDTCDESIGALDELVKSRFVEMFGEESWSTSTIGELATDIRYGTSKKASDDGAYTYLRMNNMTDDGRLDFSDTKRITLSEAELDKCLVHKGDLLFNRTNSREKVGKTAVFEESEAMVIAGYIIRVRLGSNLRSKYLAAYMNLPHVKTRLRSMAKGAVHQANINAKQLSSIRIPVPPIKLQDDFISFSSYVDKLRFVFVA